jgi:hypothetical protein
MNDWGNLLNNTAQQLFTQRVTDLSAPSKPVSLNPATGMTYTEGQPDNNAQAKILGLPSGVVIAGGAVLALAAAYFLLRK